MFRWREVLCYTIGLGRSLDLNVLRFRESVIIQTPSSYYINIDLYASVLTEEQAQRGKLKYLCPK